MSDTQYGFFHTEPISPCFTFYLRDGVEFIRVEANGDVFVRGTKVDSDREVYERFREYLGLGKAVPR